MKKNQIWIASCAVMIIAIIAIIGFSVNRPAAAVPTSAPTNGNAEVIVQVKEVEKLVQVEKTITAEMIRENLRDMGVLITQEYDFTEVINFAKEESKWFLFKGKAGYICSYDGVITAGIDFTDIDVKKDDSTKTITIRLPEAAIQNVDVDPDSFTLYSESSKLGTHITAEEFAESLSALEMNAKAKAIDRGILTKADANAQQVVRNFVSGLVDTTEYHIEFGRK